MYSVYYLKKVQTIHELTGGLIELLIELESECQKMQRTTALQIRFGTISRNLECGDYGWQRRKQLQVKLK